MDIFIVVIEDHHTDVDVMPFSDEKKAIAYARKLANDSDRGAGVDETLTAAMKEDGWVYNACYSEESDNVHVVRKTLDALV